MNAWGEKKSDKYFPFIKIQNVDLVEQRERIPTEMKLFPTEHV